MSEVESRVGLLDLAKGVLRAVPEWRPLGSGLLSMVTLRPDAQQSIGRVVEYWARKTPHNPALLFEDKRWTYAEFNTWANKIAASFSAQGVKAGDSVAILMENRPEVLACVTAAVKLGAVAAMLNHNQRGDVQAHSIRLVRPKIIVVGGECLDAINSTPFSPQANPDIGFLWADHVCGAEMLPGYRDLDADIQFRSPRNPASTNKVRASQPCYFIFTSGTTGMPKASVMTHYRWLAGKGGMSGTVRLNSSDVFYCCLPLYHNNALTVSWGCVLGAGAAMALERKFSASRFWDRIRHYNATGFCYIGELLRYLLNQEPSSGDRNHRVRLIVGNGLRPELWNQFEERFGIQRIYEFYGASEANIGFMNFFGVRQTAGFTPLPFAIVDFDTDQDLPVRGEDGFMRRVAKGGVGLLISEVTDRRPFDGYTDPSASEKKLLRDVFSEGDCWFNSGDLVRDQGYHHIQFVDRVGDTFRWKGENVATSEIEGVLTQAPGIEHGVVYGVTVPNADGRAGMAALSLKPGTELDGKGLAACLCDALPPYAVPLFLRIRAEQEVTGTFKYRKVELKQEAFDPGKVSEPLFVLLDRERGYEPLTAELVADIQSGKLRL
jgi:fatty-acyl-CoA synthase